MQYNGSSYVATGAVAPGLVPGVAGVWDLVAQKGAGGGGAGQITGWQTEIFDSHRRGDGQPGGGGLKTCSNNGIATGGTGSLVNSQDGQVIGGQVVADPDGTPRTWQIVVYSNFTKSVPIKIWVVCAPTA